MYKCRIMPQRRTNSNMNYSLNFIMFNFILRKIIYSYIKTYKFYIFYLLMYIKKYMYTRRDLLYIYFAVEGTIKWVFELSKYYKLEQVNLITEWMNENNTHTLLINNQIKCMSRWNTSADESDFLFNIYPDKMIIYANAGNVSFRSQLKLWSNR